MIPFKLSIFHKMLIAPLLSITLFGLYIVNIHSQQIESKKYMDLLYQKYFPILNIANENLILLDNTIGSFEDAVMAGEVTWLDNSRFYKKNIENNLLTLENLGTDKNVTKNIKNIFNLYFNNTIELSSLMLEESDNHNKINALTESMTIYLKATRNVLNEFKIEQNKQLQNTINITNAYGDKILYLGIVIGVLSLVIIIILSIFLSLSTKKSLRELLDSLKNLAELNQIPGWYSRGSS